MSADKMREEFEAWECDACTGPLTDPMWLMRDSLSPEDYGIVQVQRNWEAWQASRAALVIDLPVSFGWDGYPDGPLVMKDHVKTSIEDAGVKVKP